MRLKTIVGMMVLALFVLTIVPFGLAQEESKGESKGQAGLKMMEGVKVESRTKVESRNKESEDDATKNEERESIETEHKLRVATSERKQASERKLLKSEVKSEVREKVAEVKAEYKNLREDYADRKEKHRDELRSLVSLKKDIQTCRGEDCRSKKGELKASLKNHLQTTVEVIARSLDQLQERVENSHVLSAEEKEEALASLAAVRVKLEAQSDEVAVLAVNATKEEYHAAIKDLKETWKNAKQVQQWIIAQLINSKLENLVEKHTEYANAMEVRIETLQQAGADVSTLVSIKAEFDAAVVAMQEDLQELKAEWKDFQKSTFKQESLQDIREAQAQLKKDLKETQSILRKFLKAFQEQRKTIKAEVEAASETETSSAATETSTETSAETTT